MKNAGKLSKTLAEKFNVVGICIAVNQELVQRLQFLLLHLTSKSRAYPWSVLVKKLFNSNPNLFQLSRPTCHQYLIRYNVLL